MTPEIRALVEVVRALPLLTRKDLARRYGVDVQTISRWIGRKRIAKPVYLPGCRFPFWRPADVLAFERKQKR